MKNFILGILALVVVSAAGFFYFTRPIAAPSQNALPVTNDLNSEATGEMLYRISQNDSNVEFIINEVLRGSPFAPVGKTNQIAGDILIVSDPNGQQRIEIGTLRINARTFKTDDSRRDNAIARFILHSEDPANEWIEFKPKEIINAPKEFIKEKLFNFEVAGDLTVAGVTKPAIFKISAMFTDSVASGTAETIIKRSDFDLKIPNISFVASVDDSFTVRASIVANRVNKN